MIRADKGALPFMVFDRIVYIIACIVSLGLAYLLRVIITQGVTDGLQMQKWVERKLL